MQIKINGKDELIERAADIAGLVEHKGLVAGKIVVEYNGRIVSHEEWAGIALQEGDALEIVSFVGGG